MTGRRTRSRTRRTLRRNSNTSPAVRLCPCTTVPWRFPKRYSCICGLRSDPLSTRNGFSSVVPLLCFRCTRRLCARICCSVVLVYPRRVARFTLLQVSCAHGRVLPQQIGPRAPQVCEGIYRALQSAALERVPNQAPRMNVVMLC